jgi:hypothetical protein
VACKNPFLHLVVASRNYHEAVRLKLLEIFFRKLARLFDFLHFGSEVGCPIFLSLFLRYLLWLLRRFLFRGHGLSFVLGDWFGFGLGFLLFLLLDLLGRETYLFLQQLLVGLIENCGFTRAAVFSVFFCPSFEAV